MKNIVLSRNPKFLSRDGISFIVTILVPLIASLNDTNDCQNEPIKIIAIANLRNGNHLLLCSLFM